jgi:hypothetical protein
MPEGDVSVYMEFTPTHFPYISRTWNGEQLVEEELTTPGDYKFLSSNIIDLTEGWCIVRGSVTSDLWRRHAAYSHRYGKLF